MTTDWRGLAAALAAQGITCRMGVPLAELTTFRLGGPAPLLLDCRTAVELVDAVALLRTRQAPYRLIGGGSNLLAADAGLPYAIVRFFSAEPVIEQAGDRLHVSGATCFDALAAYGARHGLGEVVKGSGIPGTVGGAIVGNAGAFGWQIGDCLVSVELLEQDGRLSEVPATAIDFGYRHSSLKASGAVVLSAILALPEVDATAEEAERQRILELRASRHPDLTTDACAGSFFRNVEPTSKAERRQAAGWFLEEAGAKGMQAGGARVFPKHANIIIKGNASCTAADVLQLSQAMASAVKERFDLELVREVELLGLEDT